MLENRAEHAPNCLKMKIKIIVKKKRRSTPVKMQRGCWGWRGGRGGALHLRASAKFSSSSKERGKEKLTIQSKDETG